MGVGWGGHDMTKLVWNSGKPINVSPSVSQMFPSVVSYSNAAIVGVIDHNRACSGRYLFVQVRATERSCFLLFETETHLTHNRPYRKEKRKEK